MRRCRGADMEVQMLGCRDAGAEVKVKRCSNAEEMQM